MANDPLWIKINDEWVDISKVFHIYFTEDYIHFYQTGEKEDHISIKYQDDRFVLYECKYLL